MLDTSAILLSGNTAVVTGGGRSLGRGHFLRSAWRCSTRLARRWIAQGAALAIFLASEMSAWITDQTIVVDGGSLSCAPGCGWRR